MSAAGANVELRAGDAPPAEAIDLPLVGTSNDAAASSRITLRQPTKARYWLLWITKLPHSTGSDYTVSVDEIGLLR
jgi:hypothetical protein